MSETVALTKKKQKTFTKSVEKTKDKIKTGKIKIADRARRQRPRVGIVYLSNIPHGFYEKELKSYFGQFGDVIKTRVARSKKTGNSKGHAFIMFRQAEVAKIAAETMNNYLMGKRLLKAKLLAHDDEKAKRIFIKPNFSKEHYPTLVRRTKFKKSFNAPITPEVQDEKTKRALQHIQRIKKKLKECGIEYDFTLDIPTPTKVKEEPKVKSEKKVKKIKTENVKTEEVKETDIPTPTKLQEEAKVKREKKVKKIKTENVKTEEVKETDIPTPTNVQEEAKVKREKKVKKLKTENVKTDEVKETDIPTQTNVKEEPKVKSEKKVKKLKTEHVKTEEKKKKKKGRIEKRARKLAQEVKGENLNDSANDDIIFTPPEEMDKKVKKMTTRSNSNICENEIKNVIKKKKSMENTTDPEKNVQNSSSPAKEKKKKIKKNKIDLKNNIEKSISPVKEKKIKKASKIQKINTSEQVEIPKIVEKQKEKRVSIDSNQENNFVNLKKKKEKSKQALNDITDTNVSPNVVKKKNKKNKDKTIEKKSVGVTKKPKKTEKISEKKASLIKELIKDNAQVKTVKKIKKDGPVKKKKNNL